MTYAAAIPNVVLGDRIGDGAFGHVYRGRHRTLDVDVAVKLVSVDVLPDIDGVLKEARLMARLDHPNLLRVFDAGRTNGNIYLVLELMDTTCGEFRQVPPDRAVDLTLQLLAGLQALHDARVLHRDIKPANCLVRARDGRVKLADLGIASDESTRSSHAHDLAGTLPFMASPGKAQASEDSKTTAPSVTGESSITGQPPRRWRGSTRCPRCSNTKSIRRERPTTRPGSGNSAGDSRGREGDERRGDDPLTADDVDKPRSRLDPGADLPSPWNIGTEGFLGVWVEEKRRGDVPPRSIIKGRSTGIVHPLGVAFNARNGEVVAPTRSGTLLTFDFSLFTSGCWLFQQPARVTARA